MDEIKMLCINGTKKIIFRKEGNVFICFDPIDLEFYEVNMTGACILFLVSEKYSYKFMVDTLIDWFELKRAKVEQYIIEFFQTFPMRNLIMVNLLELGVPNNVSN